MDYSSIPTPPACYADFCLIPVGTATVSVAAEVAEVQKILKASGLKYTMHSAGTTVGMAFLSHPHHRRHLSPSFHEQAPTANTSAFFQSISVKVTNVRECCRRQLGPSHDGHWQGPRRRP